MGILDFGGKSGVMYVTATFKCRNMYDLWSVCMIEDMSFEVQYSAAKAK
jgi:hypothetical protein